jgi:hypothetical protein
MINLVDVQVDIMKIPVVIVQSVIIAVLNVPIIMNVPFVLVTDHNQEFQIVFVHLEPMIMVLPIVYHVHITVILVELVESVLIVCSQESKLLPVIVLMDIMNSNNNAIHVLINVKPVPPKKFVLNVLETDKDSQIVIAQLVNSITVNKIQIVTLVLSNVNLALVLLTTVMNVTVTELTHTSVIVHTVT